MESIIIILDVHGQSFWRKPIDNEDHVIILGDYLDHYEHEGI